MNPRSIPFLYTLSSFALCGVVHGFNFDDSAPVSLNLGSVDYFAEPVFADASMQMCVSGPGVWNYRANGTGSTTVVPFGSPLIDDSSYPRPASADDLYETWLNAVSDGSTGAENAAFVGRFVLEWEGTADLRLKGLEEWIVEAESDPAGAATNGRRVYELPGSTNLILQVSDFDLFDPITSIDLWMPMPDRSETPGVDERLVYSCKPSERSAYNAAFGITEHPSAFYFQPQFLAPLMERKWANLRMMDLAETNNSPTQLWTERTLPDQFSQAGPRSFRDPYTGEVQAVPVERHSGIAWEYQIALANATGIDLWICVPHLAVASPGHVEKIAQILRYGSDGVNPYTSDPGAGAVWDGLDPSLNLYIEYSNEVWNGGGQFQGFDQYHWVKGQGAPSLGVPEQTAIFNKQVFDAFDTVWAGALDRRVRVIAWDGPVDYFFDTLGGQCDVFARTWYFENDIVNFLTFEVIGADLRINTIVDPEVDASPFATATAGLGPVDVGEGWHIGDSSVWAATGGAAEVVSDTGDTGFVQVLEADGGFTGVRGLQFTYSNTEGSGAENVLRLQVFGMNGAFNLPTSDAAPSGDVQLVHDTGDIATANVTNRRFDFSVDFGSTGFESVGFRVLVDGVNPSEGDALSVSRCWMTNRIDYPADAADQLNEANYQLAFDEWKRRMLKGVSTVFGDDAWAQGDSFYGNGILKKSQERGIPATTYEAGAATATWEVDGGSTADDWTTLFLAELYDRPGGAEIYRLQLEKSRSAGIRGFNLFKVFGVWNKWGQWGHVRNPYGDIENDSGAIRFREVRDFHDEHLTKNLPGQVTGAAPSFTTSALLKPGQVGETYYGQPIQFLPGDGTTTFTLIASVLPEGLVVDEQTGEISGTPLEAAPGYLYARLTDADGDSVWQRFLLRVLEPLQDAPIVLDFEGYPTTPLGATHEEFDGFVITSNNSSSNNVKIADPDWTGWPRKWESGVVWVSSQTLYFYAADGGTFDWNGVTLGSNAAGSFLVEGFVDGALVTDRVVNTDMSDPSGNPNRMTTVEFDASWRGIDEVHITPYEGPDLTIQSWVGIGIDDLRMNEPRMDPPPDPIQLAPLLMQDPHVLPAPDGNYYLTGTTSRNDDRNFDHNAGIDLWRSADLENWVYVGRVWDLLTAGTSATTNQEWGVPADRIDGYPALALTAPEIHFADNTYWLIYSLNGRGTGILRSNTGLPEGPYDDVGLITSRGSAPSLFADGGSFYWLYAEGWIGEMVADLTSLAERPEPIELTGPQPAGQRPHRVERSGVSLFVRNGLYHLVTNRLVASDGLPDHRAEIWVAAQRSGPYWPSGIVLSNTGSVSVFETFSGEWMATFSDPTTDLPMVAPLPVDADLDGDFLPDWWEALYGPGGAVSMISSSDLDGDNVTALGEFLFGTNPSLSDRPDSDCFFSGSSEFVSRFRMAPVESVPFYFEVSDDLKNWSVADPGSYTVTPDGAMNWHELRFDLDSRRQLFIRANWSE